MLEAALRGRGLPEAAFDTRRDPPCAPIRVVAPDPRADRAAGRREIAGRLVDERQLDVRRRGPRLDLRRVGGVAPGKPQIPGARVRLAPPQAPPCLRRPSPWVSGEPAAARTTVPPPPAAPAAASLPGANAAAPGVAV